MTSVGCWGWPSIWIILRTVTFMFLTALPFKKVLLQPNGITLLIFPNLRFLQLTLTKLTPPPNASCWQLTSRAITMKLVIWLSVQTEPYTLQQETVSVTRQPKRESTRRIPPLFLEKSCASMSTGELIPEENIRFPLTILLSLAKVALRSSLMVFEILIVFHLIFRIHLSILACSWRM